MSSAVAQASILGVGTAVEADDNDDNVGGVVLSASNNMDATANADGKAKTSSGGTSVGVAVAINVADMVNEATIGAGASVTADGLTLRATMKDVAGDSPDTHRFGATSLSGERARPAPIPKSRRS